MILLFYFLVHYVLSLVFSKFFGIITVHSLCHGISRLRLSLFVVSGSIFIYYIQSIFFIYYSSIYSEWCLRCYVFLMIMTNFAFLHDITFHLYLVHTIYISVYTLLLSLDIYIYTYLYIVQFLQYYNLHRQVFRYVVLLCLFCDLSSYNF